VEIPEKMHGMILEAGRNTLCDLRDGKITGSAVITISNRKKDIKN
jgi:hypothetical protein